MSQDFVEQVTSDSWLSAAKGWIRHRLAGHGMEVRSIEQRRVRPWSTGLVASTDAGPMYFKASARLRANEGAKGEAGVITAGYEWHNAWL